MNQLVATRKAYEHSTSEHGRLLTGSEAVLTLWPADAREAVRKQPYLVEVLNELRSRLQKHFVSEEIPEYLSEAIAAASRLGARAHELQQQHAKILTRLEQLIANVRSRHVDIEGMAVERESLLRLIHDMRQHEQAEDDLLLEALEDDIGGGD